MNTIASFASLGILIAALGACTETSSSAGTGGGGAGGGGNTATTSSAGGAPSTSTTATTSTTVATTTTTTSAATTSTDASSSASTGAGGAGAGGGSTTSTGGSMGHPGSSKVTEQWITDYCTAKANSGCDAATDVGTCTDIMNPYRLGTDPCSDPNDAAAAVAALEKLFADCAKITGSDIMCDATGGPVFVDMKCAQDDDAFGAATVNCF